MVGRPRTRSNPETLRNTGRILIQEGSDGISHYSYRGDVDYERHLADFNRRNNIPEDVATPPSNTDEQEIPAANLNRSDPPFDNDDDENNINDNNDHLSIEELELQAIGAYSKKSRSSELDKGLAVLYAQRGVLNIKADAFVVFNFTEEEKREILNKYLKEPFFQRQELSKSEAVQIVEGLYRLGKVINKKEVESFQAMSDKFGDKHIDLNLLVDKHARHILDATFDASKN